MQDPVSFGAVQEQLNKQAITKSSPTMFPEQEQLRCPRCDSTNTKFCYYNNYNLSQPRHFCKSCRRYWTKGGALRNIPVGGGSRKNSKRSSSSVSSSTPATAAKRPSPSPSPSPAPSTHNPPPSSGPGPSPKSEAQLGPAPPVGGFASLLAAPTGQFGSIFDGLGPGPGTELAQGIGLEFSMGSGGGGGGGGGGASEGFLSGMQNGWAHDLAIFTPAPRFQ